MFPLDCQLELFQTCIEPILLYGCEIWGTEKVDIIEHYRLKCLKMMFNLKPSTPAYMIYGELGLLPLTFHIQKRILAFWGKLITAPEDRISSTLYEIMLINATHRNITYNWVSFIEQLLNRIGYGDVWVFQKLIAKFNGKEINRRIYDITLQQIKESSNNSNKGRNYLLLKGDWVVEHYIKVLEQKDLINVLKFRTANHRLPIETGRFYSIEYKDRMCPKCTAHICQ